MNFVKKTLIAAAIAGLGSQVGASQFYINTAGTGVGPAAPNSSYDASVCATCSGLKDELNINYMSQTTITLGDASLDVGDALVTVGGLNFGTANASVNDLNNYPTNNVSSFDPTTKSAKFRTDPADIIDTTDWGLSFSMNLVGKVAGLNGLEVTEVEYTGGTVEVYVIIDNPAFGDTGNLNNDLLAINIFDLTVTSSQFSNSSNFEVLGNVSFSGNEDPAFADFFNIAGFSCGFGESFSDIAACMPPVEISWLLDQNLAKVTAALQPDGTVLISGTHEGSVAFNVPVPAPLALIGGALLGLASMRRKQQA